MKLDIKKGLEDLLTSRIEHMLSYMEHYVANDDDVREEYHKILNEAFKLSIVIATIHNLEEINN